ncbi:MAG TPA: ABC transporter permease [Candidatus Acidoferrales bacterium]|jgi:putative ABC transport system permease protein|nr:ABC transporter permease [Candidatus Acidoferrales bacterium]
MNNIWRDFRFGFRLLRKNPGFATVAVLALALGIGANTAIYSIVHATLLEPLPYFHPNEVVMVWSKIQGQRNGVAAGDYLDWTRESTVFQGLAAWTGTRVNLATASHPEQVQAWMARPGFYTVMGQSILLGRDFLPEEGEVGKDHVTILTYRFWLDRFGGDRSIVGTTIRLNGEPYTVVGVLGPGPLDRGREKLGIALSFKPEQINHDFHWLLVMGRLKPGVTVEQANADMDRVTQHIAEVYPKSDKGWGAIVSPLKNDFLDRDVIRALWLLLGAVGFVLLIACANVANLLLARATKRRKEVAVRASVGASRWQLFRQFLAESLALASLGGILGIALAWLLLKVILLMMPPFTLPYEANVRLNPPVLLFTLAATALAGVLFGCAPAWQSSHLNLNDVLKEGGRTSSGGGRHGLRRALVIAEFALALSLLAGGGMAIHSLWNVEHVELGFRTDHLLTFDLPVPHDQLTSAEEINSFYRQLLDRIKALPGVSAVSVSTGMPLRGTGFGMPFQIVGKTVDDPSKRPGAGFNMVTPEYFRTFGIRLDQGREFTDQDLAGGAPVALVNEIFVKRYLEGVNPLTQRIAVEQLIPGVTKLGPYIEWQIVGVYHNVHNGGVGAEGFPEIDVPFWQSPWPSSSVAVRTSLDPATSTKSISEIVLSMNPNLPLAEVKTMDQIKDESMAGDRFSAFLFGSFAGLALLLAALGIYGVMSFAVAQRTHEIGLRIALGAGQNRVVRLIIREGMTLAAIGLLVGLAGAFVVGRVMHSLFTGVGAMDPVAFAGVAALLLLSALLACYVPALRAAKVDPMQALREE